MEKAYDHLREFETAETKPGRIENLTARLDFVFVIYITGLLVYKYYYLEDPFGVNIVYQLLFMIAVPLLLWWLFIKRYKAGWFLRALYYSIFVIVLGLNLLSQKTHNLVQILPFVVICLSAAIVVTGFFRKTLDKLKIGRTLIATYMIIVLVLIFLFFKFLFLKR